MPSTTRHTQQQYNAATAAPPPSLTPIKKKKKQRFGNSGKVPNVPEATATIISRRKVIFLGRVVSGTPCVKC